MSTEILTSADVDRLLSPSDAVAIIESYFRYHADGSLEFEPRYSFDSAIGTLKFSIGAIPELLVVGARISGKFPQRPGESVEFEVETPVKADVYVVFDVEEGQPLGTVEGSRLADLRTGAIGGVAIDHLASEDVSTLGVIGTGRMAWTGTEVAAAVREFDDVQAYSRTPANRRSFAEEMSPIIDREVRAVDSAEAAVRGADVLITATTSPEPVLEPEWIDDGAHVNVVGPLFVDAHEVGLELFDRADLVATDSFTQLDDYGDRYLLAETQHRDRMVELNELVVGNRQGREATDETTVFCPIGIPGSEVVLAHEVLTRHRDD